MIENIRRAKKEMNGWRMAQKREKSSKKEKCRR